MILEIPLDIYSDFDGSENRMKLAIANCIFFISIAVPLPININNFLKINIFKKFGYSRLNNGALYFFILCLVLIEPFILGFGTLTGNYSNDKPGYYYAYISVLIAIYYSTTKELNLVFKHMPNSLHILWAILAGERLMILTAILSILFSIKNTKINFTNIVGGIFVLIIFVLIDVFRSEASIDGGFVNKFVFSGTVTHHGSLLYSSVFLVDYSNHLNFNFNQILNSIKFLVGLDGSTQGMGLAELLERYGKRGGGGFITSYFFALFGLTLGIIFTLVTGFFYGYLLEKFSKGFFLGPLELVFLTFSAHAFVYTPVLIFKPIIYASFILLAMYVSKNITINLR
jgi:hypothetical protein